MSFFSSALLYNFLSILGVVLAGILVSNILQQKRPPSTSMAWIIFMITLPYLAIPLYLTIGTRKLNQKKLLNKHKLFLKPSHMTPSKDVHLDNLLDSYGIPPAQGGNSVNLHRDGIQAKKAFLDIIDHARQQIDICTFILANDALGSVVIEHLAIKAQQGIHIRLLLDGVGSFLLTESALRTLRKKGVEIFRFIPVVHRPLKGRTNLRNHRKLLLVDGNKVWSGGRNLAIEYFDQSSAGPAWIDLSFDLTGPAARYYQDLFDADWEFSTQGKSAKRLPAKIATNHGGSIIRLLPSGPDVCDDPLQATLLSACFEASERILAITPYFVPDDALQEALCLAARQGICVDLVLPERSNHRLADLARGRYLRELNEAGANIYLYPEQMVHAKAILFDSQLAICGSANLDMRSLYLNFESMTLFYSANEIQWLANWLNVIKTKCQPFIFKQPGKTRELVEGMALLLSFQL